MKSVFGLGVSIALEALLPLVRLIILARFLPQDQFGIAVTVLVTLGIVEMCCDLGLVQSAIRGSNSRPINLFINTLHSLSLLRYVVVMVAAVVILSVHRLTLDTTFGLDVIAVSAAGLLFKGFENLHVKQLTRSYNFWRESQLTGGMQIVWTLVTLASVMIHPSPVSVFHGMLAAILWVVVYSNLVSSDRLQMAWDKPSVNEAIRFGVPMVPNGIASAVVAMDRVIVSNLLGTRAVAVYGVAIGLATLPRAVLYKFSVSALVPHFANLAGQPEKERRFYRQWMLIALSLSTAYAISLITLGPFVIHHVFGDKYVPSQLLMTLVAINAVIKFMMLVPVPAAFARGQTSVVFLGSLISALANIPAAAALLLGMRNLETFVLALDICEGAGLLWFLLYASRSQGEPQAARLATVVAPLLLFGALTLSAWPIG